MSNFDCLITELCPNDMEFVSLCDVARICNGRDHKALPDGNIPVYGSGGIMRKVDTYMYNKPSVLIPRKGSLNNVYFVDTPFWTVDTIFYTVINEEKILPKFFYYFIVAQHLENLNQAGGVPSLTKAVLDKVKVPLPPLQVQCEIVRLLDKLTELVAKLTMELTAELTARKKQYEYYRNHLFIFGDAVPMVPLGEIGANLDSKRRPVTKGVRETGEYPYYGASGIVDYVSDYIFDGDYLLISEDGANLLARNTPIAFSASGKIWVNNHAHVLEFETYATRRYVEFYLNSIDLSRYISTAAQPKLNQENLNKISIPLPSLEEQASIVAILDKFDAQTTDISGGLLAEIEARNRQYEYYRNKLLTFKELEV